MNILIPSHSICKQHVESVPIPKTRRRTKKQKCQNSSPRVYLKTAPKQEKITNAHVLLRASDVRGEQMKLVTFAPLTSEVDD
jgi:hypothetical protein